MLSLVFLFPWGTALAASVDAPLDGQKCRPQVVQVLDTWETQRAWSRFLSPGARLVYRTPTKKIGTWIELRLEADGTIELLRLSPHSRTRILWDRLKCSPKLSSAAIPRDEKRLKDAFDDKYFETLASRNESGVLYLWSPHMPYSLKGWDPVSRAAKQLNLPVFPVLDPHASPALLAEMPAEFNALKAASRRLESWELIQRGVGAHYPTTVLFSKGRVVGPVFPGVKSEGQYVEFFKEYLAGAE
jgi:hypothetical protein